jgi:ribose transport system substrate-binding protein
MQNMTWKGIAWTLAIAVVAVGCSPGADTAATTTTTTTGGTVTAPKDIKIALIAKSSTNPVFLASRTGAEAAAKDLSKDGTTVTIDWLTPQNESGEEQAKRIAQAVTNKNTAILISCSDAAKVTGAINSAVDAGLAVMTFDSDAPTSKRFAFYGADDEAVGTETMDELAKQMGEKGNVAILAGNQTAPNLQKRKNAVIAEAARYPNIKIVDTFYHVETPDDASQKVRSAMSANPQINGWAMVGGWPLFARSLLDLDPNKVKIVAVDALPAELDYVDRGIAPVLLAQPVYDWGYKSVGMIVDHLNGKDVPVINKMELVRVSKENLGDWANQLDQWGFTGIDKKYLAMKSNKPSAATPGETK